MLRGVVSGMAVLAMWLFVAACVLAEEVDPSLDWAPRRGGSRAELGLLARGIPDSQLEEEGDPAEVRVAKRQAADGPSLDWQLMLEDGGGEARTRVKRAQLELSSDEDRGNLEAMQEESANDGGIDGDSVEEERVEWLERRESPSLAGLSDSVSGVEAKVEKGGGDEEESEVALDKNDPKPPK